MVFRLIVTFCSVEAARREKKRRQRRKKKNQKRVKRAKKEVKRAKKRRKVRKKRNSSTTQLPISERHPGFLR